MRRTHYAAVLHFAAITGGLLAVFAVYQNLLLTEGFIQQRDAHSFLTLESVVPQTVYPILNPRSTSNLANLSQAPLTLIIAGLAEQMSLGAEGFRKLLSLWNPMSAFVSMYLAVLLWSRRRHDLAWQSSVVEALVAGLVFAINPWTLGRIDHPWILAQYATMPLILALFYEALRTDKLRFAMLSGLLFAALGSTQPHYIAITGFLIAALAIYETVIRRNSLNSSLARTGATGVTFAGVWLATSAYFLLPFFGTIFEGGRAEPAYIMVDATLNTLARNQSPINTIFLTGNHNWADFVKPEGVSTVGWAVASWVGVLSPALALVVVRSWRPVLGYLTLAGVAALLLASAASWGLTREIYHSVVAQAPAGFLLREPDRLSGVIAMGQAVGVAAFVGFALRKVVVGPSSYVRSVAYGSLVFWLLSAPIVRTYPAVENLLWGIETPNYVPVRIPDDYLDQVDWINSNLTDARRVLVMSSEQRSPVWDRSRFLRAVVASSLQMDTVTGDVRQPIPPAVYPSRFMEFLYAGPRPDLAERLARLGISHVVIITDFHQGIAYRRAIERAEALTPVRITPHVAVYRVPIESASRIWAAPYAELSVGNKPKLGPEIEIPVDQAELSAKSFEELSTLVRASPAAEAELQFALMGPEQRISMRDTFGTRLRIGRWIQSAALADEHRTWTDTLRRTRIQLWPLDYEEGLAVAPPAAAPPIYAPQPSGDPAEPLTIRIPGTASASSDVWLRLLHSPESSHVNVEVIGADGRRIAEETIATLDQSAGLRWVKLSTPASENSFELRLVPSPKLEAVGGAAMKSSGHSAPTLDAMPEAVAGLPQIRWHRKSRTAYEVDVMGAEAPFWLVLNENFDPLWRAKVRDLEVRPLMADFIATAFPILETGDFKLEIRYVGQDHYRWGIWISVAAAVTVLVLVGAASANRTVRRRSFRPTDG